MAEFESPIEVAVNTSRVFMEGLHAVLDLRLVNQSPDEDFAVQLAVQSWVLPEPACMRFTLPGGGKKRRRIELTFPRGGPDTPGSAGETRFDLDLIIDAGAEGRHRFYAQFSLAVLAHTDNRHSVNVNIGKLIEQHGEKVGMGAINEIDLSNMIKLPSSVSVNELLQRRSEPRYVPIELEYEGPVEDEPAPSLLNADKPPVLKCTLVPEQEGPRILLLTGDKITLGRKRQMKEGAKIDIVTWVMPRSDENDHASRMISGRHVQLERTGEGLRVVPLSQTNAATLDGRRVPESGVIVGHGPHTLSLASKLDLLVTPLRVHTACDFEPAPNAAAAWRDAQQSGIGGVLIRRKDGLAEHEAYLWVWSDVPLSHTALGRSGGPGVRFLSLPRLAAASLEGDGSSTQAAALVLGESLATDGLRWHVTRYQQQLDIAGDPSMDATVGR